MNRFQMMRAQMMVAIGLTLAACGKAPAPVAADTAPPATFPAGEWEVSTLTETLKSADREAPATIHKAGGTLVARVCAAPGPKPDPALFVETGDSCTTTTSAYAKNGRVNLAYNCTRPGKGMVMPTIDGKYDATTFEVATAVGSYFTGLGDYVMTQRIKGKRLGDCAPAAKAAG